WSYDIIFLQPFPTRRSSDLNCATDRWRACCERCLATTVRPCADSDRRARTPRHRRSEIPQCLRMPFARRASREREYRSASRFRSMSSCEFQLRQRGEFVAVDAALSARRPRIALRELLRIGKAAEQGFAVGNIVDHLL